MARVRRPGRDTRRSPRGPASRHLRRPLFPVTCSWGPATGSRCPSGRTERRAARGRPRAPAATPARGSCTRPARGEGGVGPAAGAEGGARPSTRPPNPQPPRVSAPPAARPPPAPRSLSPGRPRAHGQQPPLLLVDGDPLAPGGHEDRGPVAQHARPARRQAPERAAEALEVLDPRLEAGHGVGRGRAGEGGAGRQLRPGPRALYGRPRRGATSAVKRPGGGRGRVGARAPRLGGGVPAGAPAGGRGRSGGWAGARRCGEAGGHGRLP